MGPAHSMVVNKTHKKICVLTFNQADLVYQKYQNMYIIDPAESLEVEALTNPIGLKIGIVYDAAPDGQILMYQRWQVKNESVLTVTNLSGADISTFGDDTVSQGKSTIRVSDIEAFKKVVEALTYQSPVTRAALIPRR